MTETERMWPSRGETVRLRHPHVHAGRSAVVITEAEFLGPKGWALPMVQFEISEPGSYRKVFVYLHSPEEWERIDSAREEEGE